MSKCLRCGAGNEWIEPVAKEAKEPRRRRPKVRFIVVGRSIFKKDNDKFPYLVSEWGYYDINVMHRIAAALNLAEAVRRGES